MRTAALIVCIGLLLFINYWLSQTEINISSIQVSPAPSHQASVTPSEGGDDVSLVLSSFAETFERPLFDPNRRKYISSETKLPVEQDPLVTPTSLEAAPELTLLGVALSGGDSKILLQANGHDAARWYALGDFFESWKIVNITKEEATLRKNEQVLRVRLHSYDRNSASLDGGK